MMSSRPATWKEVVDFVAELDQGHPGPLDSLGDVLSQTEQNADDSRIRPHG